MHNLRANFNKFLSIAKSVFRDEINAGGNFQFYPNKPKMPDLQIITLSCLAESLSLDRATDRSENWLFGKLRSGSPRLFPDLVTGQRIIGDDADYLTRLPNYRN